MFTTVVLLVDRMTHILCCSREHAEQIAASLSVHAGEYLTGSHVEKKFPRFNVWVPAKDTRTTAM